MEQENPANISEGSFDRSQHKKTDKKWATKKSIEEKIVIEWAAITQGNNKKYRKVVGVP